MPRAALPSMLDQLAIQLQDAWTFARLDGDDVSLPNLAERMNERGWDYDRVGPFGGREAVTGRVLDADHLAELVAVVQRREELDHLASGSQAIDEKRGGTRLFFGADDANWLRARYLDDGWSLQRIAEERGCSYTTVHGAFVRLGIPRRTRSLLRSR